ncbi:pyridoxal phosphate-dependent transferase [Cladochytrium replicatum]|nr:pyridoxal phosphate-dependent transferase [Cladochytrium replicatum]
MAPATETNLTETTADGKPAPPDTVLPLGVSIPPNTPHAVSVSLPTWKSNVQYEEGDKEVLSKLTSGYPRFVVHQRITKLCELVCKRFAKPNERCYIYPTRRAASESRDLLLKLHPPTNPPRPSHTARIVEYTVSPPSSSAPVTATSDPSTTLLPSPIALYLYIFDASCKHCASLAKAFWQHSGEGISSRRAEHCVKWVETNAKEREWVGVGSVPGNANARYARVKEDKGEDGRGGAAVFVKKAEEMVMAQVRAAESEEGLHVEERFGRNMDARFAGDAKTILRWRIAGALGDGDDGVGDGGVGRGSVHVDPGNVYLFPTGMSAIYNSFRLARLFRPDCKTIQFGFPYIDTLKIQEKFGVGVHFYGNGDPSDLASLVSDFEPGGKVASEPIAALFCEFPSNPLLRSPDLTTLRSLADRHGFLLIVDETVGGFANVGRVLEFSDIVVSSLTKVFSGDSNVMGGSLVVNPAGKHYEKLKEILQKEYMDTMWSEDAVFLERNSRTFLQRVEVINRNAEALCDFLVNHPKVEQLYYPKYTTTDMYLAHTTSPSASRDPKAHHHYSGLFSVVLRTEEAARAFYDALDVRKGPSLGTNFTLASPYTILAHYGELEWAAGYGVPARLVRVSVGMEDVEWLVGVFARALERAEG